MQLLTSTLDLWRRSSYEVEALCYEVGADHGDVLRPNGPRTHEFECQRLAVTEQCS